MNILTDNGYYTNKNSTQIYTEGQYSIIMPKKKQAGKQKKIVCDKTTKENITITKKTDSQNTT